MLTLHNYMKNMTLLIGALFGTAMLNSCYFNSAGHIFDKASYSARAFTSDLKADGSHMVYADGDDYYVELPRYRMGAPVKTNYSIFDDEEEKNPQPQRKNATDVFQIPKDFAMYLTGKASGPKTPSSMTRVRNGDWIKNNCSAMPIVRQAGNYSETFRYKSPNAPWLYTAGVLDWLCVDLPVTCVENALVIAAGAVMVAYEASSTYGEIESTINPAKYGKFETSGSSGGSSSGSGETYNSNSHYEIRGFYHSQGQ